MDFTGHQDTHTIMVLKALFSKYTWHLEHFYYAGTPRFVCTEPEAFREEFLALAKNEEIVSDLKKGVTVIFLEGFAYPVDFTLYGPDNLFFEEDRSAVCIELYIAHAEPLLKFMGENDMTVTMERFCEIEIKEYLKKAFTDKSGRFPAFAIHRHKFTWDVIRNYFTAEGESSVSEQVRRVRKQQAYKEVIWENHNSSSPCFSRVLTDIFRNMKKVAEKSRKAFREMTPAQRKEYYREQEERNKLTEHIVKNELPKMDHLLTLANSRKGARGNIGWLHDIM